MRHLSHVSVKRERSGALIPNVRSTVWGSTGSTETHTAGVITENNSQSPVKSERGFGS